VIAIIAILAAMLFPVFARARESARKIQCLSNVKNIAMAVQIYLSDYDRFPPGEVRQEAIDDFRAWIIEDRGCAPGQDYRQTFANPYVRWPVVLDEYTKNRQVWSCPSAKWDSSNWWIVPDYMGDWLKYVAATHGGGWVMHGWSPGGSVCTGQGLPPGWGGSITDSIAQQSMANPTSGGPSCFSATIGHTTALVGRKTSQFSDAAHTVVCADSCIMGVFLRSAGDMLYECCSQGCGNSNYYNPDCAKSQQCSFPAEDLSKWQTDSGYRAKFTRHLGGSNIGFADGHATWYLADALVAQSPRGDGNDAAGNCISITVDENGQPYLDGLCPNVLYR